MFSQCFANQFGTIALRALRGSIGGLEKLLVNHDLNRLHVGCTPHHIPQPPFVAGASLLGASEGSRETIELTNVS